MTKSKCQDKSKIQMSNTKTKVLSFGICALNSFWILCFGIWNLSFAQDAKPEPIIVNGDRVEYLTDTKEVTASGNVEIIYKGAKLTCQKITVNTETKEGTAEGNVRLDDQKGVIEGEKLTYNFQTKSGTIIDANFRANPYFGKAKSVDKVSDAEFIALNGYASTCSLDHPHYRIGAKQINMFPGDKIQTRQDKFYLGDTPFLYLSRFNHSLKDPIMHVRLTPGISKDWGPYLLSAWRYNLAKDINGRIYLDYREQLGVGEGFGFNYNTHKFGQGDLKYYYTQERTRGLTEDKPAEFQRYFMRLRHKWELDDQTSFTSEIYKINDEKRKKLDSTTNLLKDFFYREYEKDSQPLSYALLHHSFVHSSIDFLVQKRINHWFDQLDKTPQITYSLPSINLGASPFYFENSSSLANLNKKAATSPVTADEENVTRLDTLNKISMPFRLAFFNLNPFVSSRQTLYDKGSNGESIPVRTIFYTGLDLSTKFYRIFDVKSDFLGLDLDGLRHIITPTVAYSYNHEPTIQSSKLKQIDTIDSITVSNAATLELSNKLQTKRNNQTVDLMDFLVTSSYVFKPETGDKRGSNISDFIFKLKILPYSWLRMEGDATYKHSGSPSEANYNKFTNANYDINFDFDSGHSFGIGQRYQRKGANEITSNINWRFNPKWKLRVYERYNLGHDPTLPKGLREQEYSFSRDLHCWEMDITYNVKRGSGETIWLIFRIKAFPEMEFGFDQSYHQPKAGSQSNP
jgi:lipopolysaccharide assembly outer membrane protein LptD (OstA)